MILKKTFFILLLFRLCCAPCYTMQPEFSFKKDFVHCCKTTCATTALTSLYLYSAYTANNVIDCMGYSCMAGCCCLSTLFIADQTYYKYRYHTHASKTIPASMPTQIIISQTPVPIKQIAVAYSTPHKKA